MKRIALLGDGSDHNGILITSNQNGEYVRVKDMPICLEGCLHSCPIQGHGTTEVRAVTTKTYINGKLVITEEAVAGCGAKITPPDRRIYVE